MTDKEIQRKLIKWRLINLLFPIITFLFVILSTVIAIPIVPVAVIYYYGSSFYNYLIYGENGKKEEEISIKAWDMLIPLWFIRDKIINFIKRDKIHFYENYKENLKEIGKASYPYGLSLRQFKPFQQTEELIKTAISRRPEEAEYVTNKNFKNKFPEYFV